MIEYPQNLTQKRYQISQLKIDTLRIFFELNIH
jgi:hypothetical protein